MCNGPHPFIPVSDTARVRLTYTTPGGLAMNVLHFRRTGGYDLPTLSGLAQNVIDWWSLDMQTMTVQYVSLDSVEATDIAVDNGVQVVATDGLPLNGTILGDAMPMNVSLVGTFKTAQSGRSFRGRMYFVGLDESSTINNGSAITPTFATQWQNSLNGLLSPVSFPNGDKLVVVSLCANGAWRAIGLATDVISMGFDTTTDSQRRRLPRRGA